MSRMLYLYEGVYHISIKNETLLQSGKLRLRSYFAGGNLKTQVCFCDYSSTVHSNPSRKRSFSIAMVLRFIVGGKHFEQRAFKTEVITIM